MPWLAKRIRHFAVIVTLLVATVVHAAVFAQSTQAVNEDWRSADYNFVSRMMATDANDNIYVVGDTVVGDYLVVKKFSASGALLWQVTHDPAERLRGVWIAVDRSGNPVVLASIVTGSSASPAGWLTLKYDASGAFLWADSLPGAFRDARRLAVDANDDIYVAGRMWLTNSAGNTTHDSVLVKYSAGGSMLWSAVFDNTGAIDEPYSLAVSPDGSRIGVAGVSGNLFMALMYDADGKLLWSNTTRNAYAANDLAFGPGNASYFATGTYSPQDANPYPMAIAKFDAAGNLSWLKSYSVGIRALRVRADAQGNVVATGIDRVGGGYTDWMTIKADADGSLLWAQRYDGGRNNDEWPNMLALDDQGAVYVTGTGGPNPSTGTVSYLKGVVVKYAADGTPRWAVWDDFANGKAIELLAGDSLATLQWNYLVVARHTETGLPDSLPEAPTDLSGASWFTGSAYVVSLGFADHAVNEFWVDVERCTGVGCTAFAKVGQTLGEDSTGFRDGSVARGATYRYRVRAVGFMGASGYSNAVEVTVPPATPPAAPSDLAASMSGANVALSWQDRSSNESQFYIERCEGAGCTSFVGVGAAGADFTAWTDFNAAAGRAYSYRVRAWNFDGYSAYSNTATVSTSGTTPSLPPPAPSDLAAQALSASRIRLTWTDNASDQDAVEIERCTGAKCTSFAQVAIVAGAETTFTDSGLAASTTYRYRVRAHNAAGDSAYSNIAGARTSRNR